ncbi:MAG TPA: cupin domain-containing protein, partial [Usitatibacter sp.]|nr:cupin domain-containing protein [Usitatibacter sp.]
AVAAAEVAPRARQTTYPEPFASRVAGRQKRVLGELFGLRNFGVNLTRLAPGAHSSIRHSHMKQDEFVYIVSGHPTLRTDEGETQLSPGMCAGFAAGSGNAHHLVNRSGEDVVYLEIGDRTPGEEVDYPDDDLALHDYDGKGTWSRKDGTPY